MAFVLSIPSLSATSALKKHEESSWKWFGRFAESIICLPGLLSLSYFLSVVAEEIWREGELLTSLGWIKDMHVAVEFSRDGLGRLESVLESAHGLELLIVYTIGREDPKFLGTKSRE